MKNLIRSVVAVFLTVLFCSLQQKENASNKNIKQNSDLTEVLNSKTYNLIQTRDKRLKEKLKK